MWRPPQRIKWKTDPGPWPTAQQAADSLLFKPLAMGPLQLSSRTWVPAMVPWRATEDGFVTPANIEWYARFASGKPGVIVIEATGVRDVPSGPLLRIGDDRFIPGLRKLVDAVREASNGQTKLFIQLIDFLSIRRRPDPQKFFERFLRITDAHRAALNLPQDDEAVVRAALLQRWQESPEAVSALLSAREREALEMGERERVTDVHLPHIRDLPQHLPGLFADAAARAIRAGFDGIELHYAHAYTMSSFLSALNTREDGWGGAREARVRLPLAVYQAVRERVGNEHVVGCRFLADDIVPGGNRVADAAWFGEAFARAGMDFISLSRGGRFEDAKQPKVGGVAYPYTGPSGYECMPQYISDEQGPFGRNVEPARQIRQRLRDAGLQTPVVTAGGIYDFASAERLLQDGAADIVGLARQSLADPDWFEKVRSGHGAAVNLCRYTNYCEALDAGHEVVTCELWDRKALDAPGIMKTPDGKRRMVPPPWQRD